MWCGKKMGQGVGFVLKKRCRLQSFSLALLKVKISRAWIARGLIDLILLLVAEMDRKEYPRRIKWKYLL